MSSQIESTTVETRSRVVFASPNYIREMFYCETCQKDINIHTKTYHIESQTFIEKEVISGINKIVTDET